MSCINSACYASDIVHVIYQNESRHENGKIIVNRCDAVHYVRCIPRCGVMMQ